MNDIRAFVAIDVPVHELAGLDTLLSELGKIPGVKGSHPGNVHITLRFLGEISPPLLSVVRSVVGESLAGMRPFEVRVRGVGTFPSRGSPRVIWARAESPELMSTAEKVNSTVDRLGIKAERPFHPHITLARVRRPRAGGQCGQVISRHRDAEFGVFTVGCVALKSSTLTPSGPIYRDLASWPARAGTGAPSG